MPKRATRARGTTGDLRLALVATALLAAGAARGAGTGAVPSPLAGAREAPEKIDVKPPAVPSPQPIPVEHVFRAADDLAAPLRAAEAAAGPDPAVEEVERRLEEAARASQVLRARLDAQRLGDTSAREIERLRQGLAREDLFLADGQLVLEKRAERVATAERQIEDRLASWQLTAEAARGEQAPPAVLRRVAQVEESLRAAEARLRTEGDRLLGIQGRVSEVRAGLSLVARSVEEADAALQRQLFEVESAPLWRALSGPNRTGALGGQLRQALRENGRDLADFLAEEQERLFLHLAIFVALALGLLALRRPVAAMGAEGAALRGAAQVLSRPWSAALLLSLPLAGGLYPLLPPSLRDLLFLVFLAPLLRVLPGLMPDLFRRPLYGLVALFALDKLASIAPPRTLLARLTLLLVTVGALAGLVRGLRRGGWARFLRAGAWRVATRSAAVGAAALLAVSAVSNVVGNVTLAERLTHATLASATLAAVLLGVDIVLEGALAALLRVPALQRRPLVARHRALLERRIAGLLRAAAVALWAWRTAKGLGVAAAFSGALKAVLGVRLHVGGLDVSLGNVVAFAVTLAVSLALSKAIRFVLDEGVFSELRLPRGIPAAVSTTVQYGLVLLGFSWAVLASGMEMSRFSFLLGALGLGIGFGLQNVVNNFVSGLILLYERPIQVRDIVEVGTIAGEVTRIGVRSSTVRTFTGAEVIVPNATLISDAVTNWTLSDRRRRIDLGVGVAYGTAPQQVIDLLLAVVRGRAGVLDDPAPVALFLRFGESSMEFALRFWTADFDRWVLLASEVMVEVHASLGRAGIQIPFPQRDLHVRSLAPAAAEALAAARMRRGDGSARAPSEPPSPEATPPG
ncbi:mechanosensitive ion channel domain-containing protein [Anaeromyxobacter oryzae]|uniref:MscS Mechanosensitive ion channel n=1 Tax=Anaeromyxobacter oryzae TaxID=2918170 RepID=A0ABM7WYX1_9BACT|nr:mechanosensitive ion channel domain-containing protein [Anaeromyxobacter oryzae]BDG04728.1 hypothetical protein AMOR_37240 [Anaeromyxobacter oryzae]